VGRRIGLLGGTFDPPHVGHLWLAETAREQLQLDEIWFLPVGEPPHKTDRLITAVSHRLHMTQLAIADHTLFFLKRDDIDRPLPHTTVTLLQQLKRLQPATDFWLILGGDSLNDLPTWSAPQTLIQLCRLGVLPRPGTTVSWRDLVAAIPGIETAVDQLDGPTCELSSTDIRHWARQGSSLRYLLPTAVIKYIKTNQLYMND